MTGVTWPDSSASGFTMTGQTRAPLYITSALNGHAVLRFSNTGGNQTMSSTTGPDFSASGGYTIVFIGTPAKYIANSFCFWLAANGVQGSQNLVLQAGTQGFGCYTGGGPVLGPGIVYGTPYITIYTYVPSSGSSGAGVVTVRRNGQVIYKSTGNLIGWDNTKPWFIGGRGASDVYGYTGDIAEVAAYGRVLTEADCRTLENYASSSYGVSSATSLLSTTQFVFDGNSITDGANVQNNGNISAAPVLCFVEQSFSRMQQFGMYRTWNLGLIGQQTTTMTTRAPAFTDTLLASGFTRNVLIYNEMVNDIISGAQTATQAYANYKAYGQARRTAGWNAIVCVSPGSMGTTAQDNTRVAACALLKSDFTVPTTSPYVFRATPGITYADYYVDVSDSPSLGPVGANSNTGSGGLYYDALHPQAGGHADIAQQICVALGNIVNPPAVSTTSGQIKRGR